MMIVKSCQTFVYPRLKLSPPQITAAAVQVIALADLLFLLYITVFNICVCLGLTDYPVEVTTRSLAGFLG